MPLAGSSALEDAFHACQLLASSPSIQLPGLFLHSYQNVRGFPPNRSFSTTQPHYKPQSEALSATELSGLAAKLAEDANKGPNAPPGSAMGRGPLVAYREGREEGLLRADPRQEATIEQLQRLYDELLKVYPPPVSRSKSSRLTLIDAGPTAASDEEERPWWRFKSLLDGIRSSPTNEDTVVDPQIKGLYMYGGVGCGKTMLMDLFAACSPTQFMVDRIHFHDFMLDVHASLHRMKGSTADPLKLVADEISSSTNVLCLDEFFVNDVADAMILHRLFSHLWNNGLVLVATSNRHPDALYEGGLQRALFLPFIARLKDMCVIHDMESRTDYRKLAQHRSGLYFTGPYADKELEDRFMELSNNNPITKQDIEVAMGRHLKMRRVGGCIVYFDYDDLCGRALGAADYIALANAKHTVALAGVPVVTTANRSAAYRFVTLVDILYEHRVRLLCSAESSPIELFRNVVTKLEVRERAANGKDTEALLVDDNLGFAKDRTISRLTEMQSAEYLKAHAQTHAPELLYALEEAEKRDKRAYVGRTR